MFWPFFACFQTVCLSVSRTYIFPEVCLGLRNKPLYFRDDLDFDSDPEFSCVAEVRSLRLTV